MRAHAALACLLTCSTILNTTRNTLQRRVFISFLLLTPPHTSLSRFQHLHPLRFSSSSSKMESTTTNTDTQKEDNHATKEQTANSNMQKDNTNEQDTPAVQFLKNNNVEFSVHRYEYLEKGGMYSPCLFFSFFCFPAPLHLISLLSFSSFRPSSFSFHSF